MSEGFTEFSSSKLDWDVVKLPVTYIEYCINLWMLHDVALVFAKVVQQCCARACALVPFSISNMSLHVATGWPNARNMLHPTMLRYVAFKCRDRLAGACKCWANNVGMCCAEMLPSFGRIVSLLKAVLRLSVCEGSGQATTSGIRDKKSGGRPPLISLRPRSSTASDGLTSHPGGSRNTPSRFTLQKPG